MVLNSVFRESLTRLIEDRQPKQTTKAMGQTDCNPEKIALVNATYLNRLMLTDELAWSKAKPIHSYLPLVWF